MTPNIVLCLLVGVLFACGVYLLLARSLSRSLLGILLLTNGVSILFLIASGPAGRAPIIGVNASEEMSDPLPQAMVLTAIVITLGLTAFILAMAHRSWQLARSDNVEDDLEDVRIAQRAVDNDMSDSEFRKRDRTDGDGAVRNGADGDGPVRDGAVRDGAVGDGAVHDGEPVAATHTRSEEVDR